MRLPHRPYLVVARIVALVGLVAIIGYDALIVARVVFYIVDEHVIPLYLMVAQVKVYLGVQA